MSYPQSEQRYRLEEYYALEKASDRRWEFWDGEIICMSGGSIEPDSPYITHYVRGPKQWKKRIYDDYEDSIEIASVGVVLTLTEIYQGVEFE